MSYGYLFICVPCREMLPVGKIVSLNEAGAEIPWQLGGLGNDPDHPHRAGTLKAIGRFVILHRGHRLHLVPDDYVSELLDDEDGPETGWRRVQLLRDLLDRGVRPEPDPEDDARRLPSDLVEELRSTRPWP